MVLSLAVTVPIDNETECKSNQAVECKTGGRNPLIFQILTVRQTPTSDASTLAVVMTEDLNAWPRAAIGRVHRRFIFAAWGASKKVNKVGLPRLCSATIGNRLLGPGKLSLNVDVRT